MSIEEFITNAKARILKDSEIAEDDIESKFCKYAKRRRCKALKLVLLRGVGFPDRTVLCPEGKIVFIEFKRKGKTLNASQIKIRKMLTTLGFEYFTCDEIGQAEAHLSEFLGD